MHLELLVREHAVAARGACLSAAPLQAGCPGRLLENFV
jgi:hypothetical protein